MRGGKRRHGGAHGGSKRAVVVWKRCFGDRRFSELHEPLYMRELLGCDPRRSSSSASWTSPFSYSGAWRALRGVSGTAASWAGRLSSDTAGGRRLARQRRTVATRPARAQPGGKPAVHPLAQDAQNASGTGSPCWTPAWCTLSRLPARDPRRRRAARQDEFQRFKPSTFVAVEPDMRTRQGDKLPRARRAGGGADARRHRRHRLRRALL
jgi:hypothetical protein